MESVHGLIAPPPCSPSTATATAPPRSPASARSTTGADELYALYGKPDQFRGLVYENTPHSYTRPMWDETLSWFKAKL